MSGAVRRLLARTSLSFAGVVVALIAWDRVAVLMGSPELLPGPDAVLKTFTQMVRSGEIPAALSASLFRVGAGYSMGAIAGILTGLLLGAVRPLNNTLGLIVEFLKGIPPIALVPLAIMWFGIGEVPKVLVIAFIVWIVVGTSTTVGASEVPLARLRAGAFLGLGPLATFRRIVLPSAAPYVASGMRSAVGFSFVALVSAELIAANSGIGQIIMSSRFALQTDRMIVGLIVLGLAGALAQVAFEAALSRLRIFAVR